MAGPGSTYDPGEALGWHLPNGLVLFLWATPRLIGAADMRNPRYLGLLSNAANSGRFRSARRSESVAALLCPYPWARAC
jgi:hypothetical protein